MFVKALVTGCLIGVFSAGGWLWGLSMRSQMKEVEAQNVAYRANAIRQRQLLVAAQAKYNMAANLMTEAAVEAGLTERERVERGCAAVRLLPQVEDLIVR